MDSYNQVVPVEWTAAPVAAPRAENPVVRWLWLAAALLLVLATGVAGAGLNFALPPIARDLHIGAGTLLNWIVGGGILAFAVVVVPAAFVGDALGHARVHVLGAAVFTACSVLAATASSPWVLLVARIGQGAGAALAVPQAIGYARAHLPRVGQAVVYALFALLFAAGQPLGSLFARLLLGPLELGWRAVFWALVPIGLLSLAGAVPVLLRPVRLRFDPLALLVAFLVMVGALGVGYPLVAGSLPHLSPLRLFLLVAGFVVLGGGLVVDAVRRGVRLGFGVPLLVFLTVAGAGQATAVAVVQQVVNGGSAVDATLLSAALAVGAVVGGLFAVPLVLSVDSRTVVALGSVLNGLAAVGNLILVRTPHLGNAVILFAVCLAAAGAGYALALAGLMRGDATGPGPVFAMLTLGAIGAAAVLELLIAATPPLGPLPDVRNAWRDVGSWALVVSILVLTASAALAPVLVPRGPAATGPASSESGLTG
jgi:DHA2 family multidrug resistance protein-like MFS transporter